MILILAQEQKLCILSKTSDIYFLAKISRLSVYNLRIPPQSLCMWSTIRIFAFNVDANFVLQPMGSREIFLKICSMLVYMSTLLCICTLVIEVALEWLPKISLFTLMMIQGYCSNENVCSYPYKNTTGHAGMCKITSIYTPTCPAVFCRSTLSIEKLPFIITRVNKQILGATVMILQRLELGVYREIKFFQSMHV